MIYIKEDPPGPQNLGVLGFISFCANISNPNSQMIFADITFDFYLVIGAGPAERLVLASRHGGGGGAPAYPYADYGAIEGSHIVFANETASSGTARYAIHIIAEAYADQREPVPFDPPALDQRWINMTFKPASGDTIYREGGACGAF